MFTILFKMVCLAAVAYSATVNTVITVRFIVFVHNCMRLELPNLFVNVSSPFYISLSVIVWHCVKCEGFNWIM